MTKTDARSTAGYSGTPLAKKLGIKPGTTVVTLDAPSHYAELVEPLPDGVTIVDSLGEDLVFVHAFAVEREALEAHLARAVPALAKNGTLWLSWPKKASKVPTDLDGNVVRAAGLEAGLVDVKVCAVDATWSGLKMVYRLRDR